MFNEVSIHQDTRLNRRGYHVTHATQDDELVAVFRRRHSIFAERLNAFPTNHHGLEFDSYDARAEHIYASLEGIIVGCVRLTRDSPLGFPLEAEGVTIPAFLPRATTIEGGRFNADRLPGRDVASDLMQAVYRWSLLHHITHWIGIENVASLNFLLCQGWPIQAFGDPVEHAGVSYHPHYMSLNDAVRLRHRSA